MDKKGRILVVDDNTDVLLSARVVLRKHFNEMVLEQYPRDALSKVKKSQFDVALIDMNFRAGETSGKEGLELLKNIKKISPETCVIMITAYGDIQLAVEAMKDGATDFIVKPWENTKLIATVKSAFNLSQSYKEIKKLKSKQEHLIQYMEDPFTDMIGESKAVKKVFETIQKVAKTDANVLILGENGTGKELVARALHRNSLRTKNVFINVDLGAIAENLFESELFGHTKGAYTDAKEERAGRFEIANNGTLFLDEIGNLSMPLQAKLLSTIQNREIVKLGSNTSIPVDIRLISATNMDIDVMIRENKFRQDLLYRINTVEIRLPSLRERKDDIPLLTEHFTGMLSRKYHKEGIKITKAVLKKLENYSWPGNIRELQHVIERAVILCENNTIDTSDIFLRPEKTTNLNTLTNIEDLEKAAILKAINNNRGNLSKAAEELGLGRTTLYRKLEKYGIK